MTYTTGCITDSVYWYIVRAILRWKYSQISPKFVTETAIKAQVEYLQNLYRLVNYWDFDAFYNRILQMVDLEERTYAPSVSLDGFRQFRDDIDNGNDVFLPVCSIHDTQLQSELNQLGLQPVAV